MDRAAWCAAVHEVTKSWTRLSDRMELKIYIEREFPVLYSRFLLVIYFIYKRKESEVAQSCPTLCDPVDCSFQAPPSMEFSRQENWSGLPFPSPGDLPDPRIKPGSLALEADALTSEPPGKPTPLNPPRAPLLYDMKMVFLTL